MSAALTVVFGSAALAFTLRSLPGGENERDIRDAASRNDLDPRGSIRDICDRGGDAGDIRSACDSASAQKRAAIAGWVGAGVFATSSAILGTILAVQHRRADAKARDVRVGASVSAQGAFVAGSFRF